MKITKITMANSCVVRIPEDTNPRHIDYYPRVELTAELEAFEDLEQCAQALRAMVDAELAKQIQQIKDVAEVNRRLAECEKQDQERLERETTMAAALKQQFYPTRTQPPPLRPGTATEVMQGEREFLEKLKAIRAHTYRGIVDDDIPF